MASLMRIKRRSVDLGSLENPTHTGGDEEVSQPRNNTRVKPNLCCLIACQMSFWSLWKQVLVTSCTSEGFCNLVISVLKNISYWQYWAHKVKNNNATYQYIQKRPILDIICWRLSMKAKWRMFQPQKTEILLRTHTHGVHSVWFKWKIKPLFNVSSTRTVIATSWPVTAKSFGCSVWVS